MKRLLLAIVVLLGMYSCGIFGDGEATGVIMSVEGGMFWDYAWVKGDINSSESDLFLIRKHSPLREKLKENIGKRVRLQYNRHWAACKANDDKLGGDEIISFAEE